LSARWHFSGGLDSFCNRGFQLIVSNRAGVFVSVRKHFMDDRPDRIHEKIPVGRMSKIGPKGFSVVDSAA
jgi:hypothetical protein